MIILDTNVLSELLRSTPDSKVLGWLNKMPGESVWVSSITVFEVRDGLEAMAPGRRRRRLEDEFSQVLDEDLDGRVLDFDRAAADAAGVIAARQRRAGRSVEIRDVQIAGVASARKATLATRNIRHFQGLGLTLTNPWSA